MGFAFSLLAVRGVPREAVLEAFGLASTGAREEVPDADFTGTALPDGWYAVIANRGSSATFEGEGLARLPGAAEVVVLEIEEHVMYSRASYRHEGRLVWSVAHDAQRALDDLEVQGDPPAALVPIRNRLMAAYEAEGEDAPDYLFEVPVELVESLTGYRYDQEHPERGSKPFEVLTRLRPVGGGWWNRFWNRRRP